MRMPFASAQEIDERTTVEADEYRKIYRPLPDAGSRVAEFRRKIEPEIEKLDREVLALIANDQDAKRTWKVRKEVCRQQLRRLTMNIAFWGRDEWDWNEVEYAMAYLYTVCDDVDAVLKAENVAQVAAA